MTWDNCAQVFASLIILGVYLQLLVGIAASEQVENYEAETN